MNEMTLDLSIEEILSATGGRLIQGSSLGVVDGVSTDSRTIQPGELFVALVGENFDGHEFVPQALAKGAAGAIVSQIREEWLEKPEAAGRVLIQAPDTLRALGAVAASFRRRFDLPVVGITGSTGKTTSKEMLANILERSRKVLKTPENYNNEIGVPLTALALRPEHQVAIFELAMRGEGQIAYLSDIIRPQIGLITNIGASHMELLGSTETIAQAKAELLAAIGPEGVAVLNCDDQYFPFFRERVEGRMITFGIGEQAQVRATDLHSPEGWGWEFRLRYSAGTVPISLRIPGRHQVSNALGAAAVALELGTELSDIQAGLGEFQLVDQRMEIMKTPGGFTIINDCYNASPDSMQAALQVLADAPGDRKLAILGDMLELGPASEELHRQVGQVAAQAPLDFLITVGALGRLIAEGAQEKMDSQRIFWRQTNQEAAQLAAEKLSSGDVVLVKASRLMKLEEIVDQLLAK